ncbi:phage tail tape measure protein [Serratia proteamaculans]
MSINLGLDGLRKAVIRSNLFLNDLPGETKSLGNAMFQQRVELLASANRARAQKRNDKSARVASKERLQEIRSAETAQRSQNLKPQLKSGIEKSLQRYRAGQGVVDKIGAVSGQAMGVARQGARLLKPGYQAVTASSRAQLQNAAPSSVSGALPAIADNLAGDIAQLNSAMEAVSVDIFVQLDGTLRSLTKTATGLLSGVDEWIKDNPTLAGGIIQLVAGGGMLITALGGMGSVMVPVISGLNLLITGAGLLSSVFTFAGGAIATALAGVSLLTLGIAAGIAVLVGIGVALIYKYWEPISAFFAGVMRGIGAALSPLKDFFAPFENMFDGISQQASALYARFKTWLEPVHMTGDALNKIGGAGEWIGKALGDAFMAPLNILRDMREGIDWVLEKLGVVDKKSSDAKASLNNDRPAQRPSVALGGADYVSPDGPSSVAFGGASYKPVTAGSISNSQQSIFNSSYVINTHDGMSQADVLAIMEKNRQQEQFNADLKQRSSVWR